MGSNCYDEARRRKIAAASIGDPLKSRAAIAFILCAGEGARLRPLTDVLPKPLLPMLDRAMVIHLLDALRKHGIERFLVNLHHGATAIRRVLSAYASENDVAIHFSEERRLLDTGGALRKIRHLLREPFFLINADFIPAGFSFAEMEAAHEGMATLAVCPLIPGTAFNSVAIDTKGRIARVGDYFGEGEGTHRFLGVQRIDPAALEHLGDETVFSVFTGLYDRLFAAGHVIGAYRCDDIFPGDPGTLSGYREAQAWLLRRSGQDRCLGQNIRGLDEADVKSGSVLGQDVRLGAGARIERSILFPGVRIPAGVLIRDSIVGSSVPGDLIGKAFMAGKERALQ